MLGEPVKWCHCAKLGCQTFSIDWCGGGRSSSMLNASGVIMDDHRLVGILLVKLRGCYIWSICVR